MTCGAAAGLTTLLTLSLIAGGSPASAESGRDGQLHIVKDCDTWSETPGLIYCHIVDSNLPELPPGTRIYYNQVAGGPTAGPGFLDSNIFVYVNNRRWAVGRCTTRNDDNEPGLCTLSDGVGSLAGVSARIEVTKQPGGSGSLYAWNGIYRFEPIWGR
jgi:hypothetical protein